MSYSLLGHLKVVEWGTSLALAVAGKHLADLGASVVKVELPAGDPLRRLGPFPADLPAAEKSGAFLALNINKAGVTLNPTSETGRSVFTRLVASADVLLEDHRPEDLGAWRLDYAALSRLNPSLVMTSVTPFGQSGPYRDFAATDLTLFHMSGYARVMAERVSDPEAEPPVRAQGEQTGFIGGMAAACATTMALMRRRASGRGAHVDVSVWEAMTLMAQGPLSSQPYGEDRRSRRKGDVPMRAVVAVLPTTDGYIAISPREEDQWERWLDLMGNPEWGKDPRFVTRDGRKSRWEELEPLVAEFTRQRSKEDLYRQAQERRIPSFPINTPADLFELPHLKARGFFQRIIHPEAGELPYTGAPFRLAEQEPEPDRPAPLLGQHNAEVYRPLGYSQDDLVRLKELGAI